VNDTTIKKQVVVVCGVVKKGNKILMLRRNERENPQAHLKWEFPGGKIEFSESPEEALKREVIEEAGAEVEINRLLPYIQTSYWDYEWGIQKSICLIYLCEFVSQLKILRDHRVADIQWFETEEIEKLDSLPGTNEIIDILQKGL
jgi:8-oxo-dGTP diphosphatase